MQRIEDMPQKHKSWSDQFYENITTCINEGVFGEVTENANLSANNAIRVLVGMLILKEAFDYSDLELFNKLNTDSDIQNALGLNGIVSRHAYNSFCLHLYKHEKLYGRNLITECFIGLSGKRCVRLFISGKEVIVDSVTVFTHVAHKIIYDLMIKALEKCVHNRKNDLEGFLNRRVKDVLQVGASSVTYNAKANDMEVRLLNLGKLSYEVLRRYNIKPGTSNQLRNYFDKYFEELNGQIIIKEVITDKDIVYQGEAAKMGGFRSRIIEHVRKISEQRMQSGVEIGQRIQSSFNNSEMHKIAASASQCNNDEIHDTNNNKEASKPHIGHNDNLAKLSIEDVSKRLDNIEKTLAGLSEMVERHFVAMQPIEKMLLRLETLYNNLVCLDSKILSQEASLNFMVHKHVKISEYTQDLSKTSKDIYDLIKLLLMNSIVEQTKDIEK